MWVFIGNPTKGYIMGMTKKDAENGTCLINSNSAQRTLKEPGKAISKGIDILGLSHFSV